MKVAVLGVGLIGGSIGLAARRRAGTHVVGYDVGTAALSDAVEIGAIDESALEIADAVHDADVVFIATPVGSSAEVARAALDAVSATCVVSDVGSTKRQIARAIADPRFVGGHPLAGAETAGVRNAREDLFDGATWYLTPAVSDTNSEGEDNDAVASGVDGRLAPEHLHELIESFGAQVVEIDAETHDRLMASVSHLPHVLANVLVAQALRALQSSDASVAPLATLGAGPSFRDATRVAGANTTIWTDIYLSNGDLLVEALEQTIGELGNVRDLLQAADGEALSSWNEYARLGREQLRQTDLAPGP